MRLRVRRLRRRSSQSCGSSRSSRRTRAESWVADEHGSASPGSAVADRGEIPRQGHDRHVLGRSRRLAAGRRRLRRDRTGSAFRGSALRSAEPVARSGRARRRCSGRASGTAHAPRRACTAPSLVAAVARVRAQSVGPRPLLAPRACCCGGRACTVPRHRGHDEVDVRPMRVSRRTLDCPQRPRRS